MPKVALSVDDASGTRSITATDAKTQLEEMAIESVLAGLLDLAQSWIELRIALVDKSDLQSESTRLTAEALSMKAAVLACQSQKVAENALLLLDGRLRGEETGFPEFSWKQLQEEWVTTDGGSSLARGVSLLGICRTFPSFARCGCM